MKHYLSLLFCLLICVSSMAQGKGKFLKSVGNALMGKGGVELIKSHERIEDFRRRASSLNMQTKFVVPVRENISKLVTPHVRMQPGLLFSDSLRLSMQQDYIPTQWRQPDTIAFASERLVACDTTGKVFQLPSLILKLHKDCAAMEPVFVDLGLPSGTLWKSHDEPGFFSQSAKDSLYAGQLPTMLQFYELWTECTWTREQFGYRVEGKNGNHIMMPSYAYCASNGKVYAVRKYASYWLAPDSSRNTAYYVFANMKNVGLAINPFYTNRISRTVRLVQNR